MNNYSKKRLGPIVDVLSGYAFDSAHFTNADAMPLVRIRDLENSTTDINYQGSFNQEYVIENGDLLIGMDGDFTVSRWKGDKALLNQRVCKLQTRDTCELGQLFLYYSIVGEIDAIHKQVSATTVKHLSVKHIQDIEVLIPPIAEQTVIAEVLATVDRAIAQSEALIAKQRRIKAGLLHDLLTRGIDEKGNLRHPATHRFKESPVGPVPEEWEVGAFGEHVETSAFGPRFSSAFYAENGTVAMLRTTDLDDEGHITSASLPRANLDFDIFSKHFLQNGDVVISRSGTIGVTTVFVGYEIPVIPAAFMIRFRMFPSSNPEYVRLMFNAPLGRRLIYSNVAGGVQGNITSTAIAAMVVPLPPKEEQDVICGVLNSANVSLEQTQLQLDKLKLLKTGLMQDLLSGRVSVAGLLAGQP